MFNKAWELLADAPRWTAPDGHWARIMEHLAISGVAMLIALLIAVPIGLWIGHTGRGGSVVVALSGVLRAVPSLGLLTVLALMLPGGTSDGLVPSLVVLVILAVPPILAGVYSGMRAIPRYVVDGACAVGHSEGQILRMVEVPLSASSIVDGIRSAALQVVATTTICAYLGTGGLGRYLIDGLALSDYPVVIAGAVLVIGLIVVLEAVLSVVSRVVAPAPVALRQ
ncbi:ABC transporter permease [Corynebacterium auriscanis]|uniref:ABC transporter permease n=1 Tax=Corynebacterium auriscanis TaxID=99807 RepID=UPI003CEA2D64